MSIHVCKCIHNGREEYHLRYPGMTQKAAQELADRINAEALADHIAEERKLVEPAQEEPVGWISVKDALPKAVRGVSYKQSLTDVVLVRHSDRPDYPITAHAVVGEGLGAGIAIPTDGASEHPEIAWYSASSNLNNPFDLKNADYERYLPKVFGLKITHWKPIDTSPPASKPWVGLSTNDLDEIDAPIREKGHATIAEIYRAIEAKLREKNAAPCKPLTDAQIGAVAADIWGSILIAPQSYQAFARAIEAAHNIKGETK